MKIIVNAQALDVSETVLSFEDVVRLAKQPSYASVTYCRAADPKSEGILSNGQVVEIKDGTIFCAVVTDNA